MSSEIHEKQLRAFIRCHCGWSMTCERPVLAHPMYHIQPDEIVSKAYEKHICGAPPKSGQPKGFASNGKTNQGDGSDEAS